MNDDREPRSYSITYDPKPWAQRTASNLLFWLFIGMLVWLSRGSAWWTFFFGTLAILVLTGRLMLRYNAAVRKFTSKAELQRYVDSLPDD